MNTSDGSSPKTQPTQQKAQPSEEKETFAAYIVIPGPVFYNRKLSDQAKLCYGLLNAMHQAPKYYAYAKNSTLMRFLDCSERKLQRCFKELEDAGELMIENGNGGRTTRKIKLTRVQPVYPDKNDGVYPDKNDGGNKNNRKNNKKKGEAQCVCQDDIIQWFNCWAVQLDVSESDTLALCTDLRDFAENREALGKPFKTIQAAVRMANRLKGLCSEDPQPVWRMRYLLSRSIRNGWTDVYGLDEKDSADYALFLAGEYGVQASSEAASAEYF